MNQFICLWIKQKSLVHRTVLKILVPDELFNKEAANETEIESLADNFETYAMFFRYVDDALMNQKISYTDAFNMMGVGYREHKTSKKLLLNQFEH